MFVSGREISVKLCTVLRELTFVFNFTSLQFSFYYRSEACLEVRQESATRYIVPRGHVLCLQKSPLSLVSS